MTFNAYWICHTKSESDLFLYTRNLQNGRWKLVFEYKIITFLICVLAVWNHKGYCVVKKLVWNVHNKAFWYTNVYFFLDFVRFKFYDIYYRLKTSAWKLGCVPVSRLYTPRLKTVPNLMLILSCYWRGSWIYWFCIPSSWTRLAAGFILFGLSFWTILHLHVCQVLPSFLDEKNKRYFI